MIYNTKLSDADRKATEHYLLAKYGLEKLADGEKLVDPTKAVKTETPLPPVKSQPVKDGLQLWARADDLKNLVDGQPVDSLADAGEQHHDLTVSGDNRPRYKKGVLGGRPALRFEGNTSANPKVIHYLNVPITGEWPEMTLLVAGRHVDRAGVFDSAPGTNGCLRTMGWLQLCGSSLAPQAPFQLLNNDDTPQTMAIVISKNDKGGQTMATYANGHQMATADSDKLVNVLFRRTTIGTNNLGETAFNGDIAEVLLYNRPLTAAEMQQNVKYLAEKYSILLKSDEEIARERKARSHWTLQFPQLPRTTSWFGNSFSGKDAWVQSGVGHICALPDGTVAMVSVWDEPHKEIGLYKDGKTLGNGIPGGGSTIAADGQYFYQGMSGMGSLDKDGKTTLKIRRVTMALKEAPWPGMKPGEWPSFKATGVWSETNGLAISNGEFYVSADKTDEVRAYDLASGQLKRIFPLAQPHRIACDTGGKLWIGGPNGVAQYTTDGQPTGKKITDVKVGDLKVDTKGRLVVADCGERQQVIFYDLTGEQPREVTTLGERGGVYAGPRRGAMGDNRLWNLNGVGVDTAGNIYVNGGGMLRGYAPDGKLRWQLDCTVFCTCGDFDPETDGADLYTGAHHYVYAPGKPAGKDYAWKGITADPQRFPEMAAGSGQQWLLRRLNGRLYRFALAETLQIHRKDKDSEIFVPCGEYVCRDYKTAKRPQAAPEKGRYLWSDTNGNGLVEKDECTTPPATAPPSHESFSSYVDTKGGIWEPQDRWGVRYLPLKRIAENGALVYDFADEVIYKRPAEFIQIFRALYDQDTDTMLLSGVTWDHPALGSEWWGQSGREMIAYDNWSKPTRKLRCRMPFPAGATDIRGITWAPKSNLAFAGEMENNVLFTYDLKTGKLLGILEPDADLFGNVGWLDIDSGLRAFTRKDGEVIVLCEDSWAQKQMIYRMPAHSWEKKK